MKKLRVLDLFSGIGGFSLGLERTGGFETVAFCEIEEFPRKVLAKHWPDTPIYRDVRELKGEDVGAVDVICGGYPCQPFSTAGKRRGKGDDRHLWPEFSRLVAELRPAWVIGENVAGHISMGLDDVLSDLEGQGYACRTFVIPACAVDAQHRRDRCWTIASRMGDTARTKRQRGGYAGAQSDRAWVITANASEDVADADIAGCKECNFAAIADQPRPRTGRVDARGSQWAPEPNVGRVANGVPNRVDRLKALGNAVVPQIPEMIGRAILEAEHRTPA